MGEGRGGQPPGREWAEPSTWTIGTGTPSRLVSPRRDSPMRHPRIAASIAGVLAAFGLGGCLPQFGCGYDRHVELRNNVYRCVDDTAYGSLELEDGSSPTTTLVILPSQAQE